MFIPEHFPLNTQIQTLPIETTFTELISIIQKGTAVIVQQEGAVALFTPEDAELLKAFEASTMLAHLVNMNYFNVPSFSLKELQDPDHIQKLKRRETRSFLCTNEQQDSILGYVPLGAYAAYVMNEGQKWYAYFAALADTVTDAVTVVNRDGAVICWNPVAEELYGLPREDIVGKRIGEHFDVETLMVLKMLDEGRLIRNTYHRPRPDTHVLINASPIKDAAGTIIGGIATEQDITQLVRLNEQLTTVESVGLPNEASQDDPFALIKGKGPAIGKVIQWAKKVAATDSPVLLIGESGVGKEQLAQIIHQSSSRRVQPFITVHCGIVPAGILETELFGYQGGAFSGNESGQPGKLELAKEGTLFINEIEKMSLELQAKLYRYITKQMLVRSGGNQPISVRTRIIIATTQDLASKVASHEFRTDLYYALNVVSIRIPPLRERNEDIPAMVHMYLKQFSMHYQKPAPSLSPEVILALSQYNWPGNIQELKNIIERCIILNEDEMITLEHLPPALQEQQPSLIQDVESNSIQFNVTEVDEITLIVEALAKTAGNKSAAAKLLGISRGTLYNKMKEFDLE
ncbi:Anaerobic nitric oxide reductase transcription regulator NorR [Paenibacillus allorhizoplanae]|uniref:Anaerobic nitric oxide reductase transcription regulator NorR n=1 Tax=Paenibacillus allorhizoplanae TaxID=2905648 RepID=A0ABM9CRJ7_9BACL|nr:sigma 54-interacting transcriptional regulator [Paenibacillus allorhizoplanae]CAH1219901.1 Anaerobic nitric oxide reductase transcription regulator NorR [Paenibacillus allorhizoplanae]